MKKNTQSLSFLKKMITIRKVEERLLELFSRGKLNGTVHTCIGQEACAVGLISTLDLENDILFSNHRGHGHYLSYCDDVEGLIGEVTGHQSGVCGGIGGSQHIQRNNFYTNGIQGAGAPIVVGMALAEKQLGRKTVSVVHLGDGTFGEGSVYEAFNIASLWDLPVIFSVECNRYAQTTPFELQHAGDLSERGRSFGIDIHKVDGMDVLEVHRVSSNLVDTCRESCRPQILFMDTYRFAPHSKGDDFRDEHEVQAYKARDPIALLVDVLDAAAEAGEFEIAVLSRLNQIEEKIIARSEYEALS